MRRHISVMIFVLAPAPVLAQQTDEQLWLQANATTSVSKDAEVTLESVSRVGDRAGGFYHAEIGGWVTFTVAKGVEVADGYRHVEDWDHGASLPNEERLRQQVAITLGGGFAVRVRGEQRFNSAGPQVGFRIRPQLRYSLPVGGKGFALFVAHEDFFNLNTTGWGQRGGYERMRNTVGFTVPLSPRLKADIGYLNQYRFGRDGARDRMDHIATMSVSLTL